MFIVKFELIKIDEYQEKFHDEIVKGVKTDLMNTKILNFIVYIRLT